MINPLSIATEGYLKNKRASITVATNGYIYFDDNIVPPTPIKSGATNRPIHINRQDITWLLKREDDEILTILKIFLKCKRNIKNFYKS